MNFLTHLKAKAIHKNVDLPKYTTKCKDYYPLGSFVTAKGHDVPLLLIGIRPTDQEGAWQEPLGDYSCVECPPGHVDSNSIIHLNHEDIESVIHSGYTNEEWREAIQLMAEMFGETPSM